VVKLAIAGGNIAGSTVLSMLRGDADIEIVGVYEKNVETPGVVLAQKWLIPLYSDIAALVTKARPEIIINVTGDAGLGETVKTLSGRIEVIDAAGARLIWKTIEKQKKAAIELSRSSEYEEKILTIVETACRYGNSDDLAGLILGTAMEVTDSPAGSIVMADGEEMCLVASKGLSKKFVENRRWKVLPGGLTERVVNEKKLTEIQNIREVDYINNPALVREGIVAVLACPILLEDRVYGIIYLDDFKMRHFSERQKRAIGLVALVAALVIERMRRLEKTGDKAEEVVRLKERAEELERVNDELFQASRHKSRFIANMSHELRTPLNSILGFSDILLDKTFGELNENQERYVKNICSSGRHLLELVNNVLDIAKIEAGKYEMSYETFPISDVMSETVAVMKPLAGQKGVELVLEFGDEEGVITADRVKIKQVFYNLLSNAIKFTPAGGKVRFGVGREDGRGDTHDREVIKFLVSDTGVGIGPDDMERIFDEFEQADASFSRQYGGAGLGLTLTRKLVELHGGTIAVESKLGEGSCFVVSIPLISPVGDERSEEAEAVSLDFPWMDAKAPLILVVEDDRASAELLTLHLTQAGYKVAHAFDGQEALEKAEALRPFAILLDIMLPKKDGWEVLQSFKSNEATSNIPVLIHSMVDNKDLAFALGAADYLMKPLDKDVLLEKVQGLNILKGRRHPTTVLVINPDGDVESLKETLDQKEFLVYFAREGRRGIELATALRPDVILLDFELPDMLGFDLVTELKKNPSTTNIPIFILTEKDISVEDRISLVGKIERIIKKHKFDVDELIDHIMEMEVLYPKRAGLVDELTGVFSHRYFQIRLAQEVERAHRYKHPLNLILLDIDFFGRYINENGGQHGDDLLKKVAELLTKNIRGSDVVVRYGGDAYAIILPNTVISAALSLGNRYTAIIKNYPFPCAESQPKKRVTASVGLAFLDGQTPEGLVLCCEKALGQAIKKGGDRVEIYSKESEEAFEPQS
jgi:diguanylate cyclase (GGDEF)-like protein